MTKIKHDQRRRDYIFRLYYTNQDSRFTKKKRKSKIEYIDYLNNPNLIDSIWNKAAIQPDFKDIEFPNMDKFNKEQIKEFLLKNDNRIKK